MNNISLFLVYPLLILVGIGVFAVMAFKEKMVKKTVYYCIQNLLFWVVGGLLMANLQDQISSLYKIEFETHIVVLMYVFGILFFNAIFRPLFSVIMKYWLHSQKKLFIITGFLQILNFALVLVMCFTETTPWMLIINIVLIGWVLALNTIQQVFFADQHYYKISSISVAFFIGTVNLLGNSIGFYIQSLTNVLGNVVLISTAPVMSIILILSLYMVFKTSEDTTQPGLFGEDFLIELKPYKKRTGYKLLGLAIVLGVVFAANNSTTTMNLMIAFMHQDGFNYEEIKASISLFKASIFLLPMILSYPIYRLLFKRIGIYFSMMILASVLFSAFLFLIFLHNGIVFLIMLMISNAMYFAIFQALFGLSIAWHFRRKSIIGLPGVIATGSILVKWLLDISLSILDSSSDSFLFNTNKLMDYINPTNPNSSGMLSELEITSINNLGSSILLFGACLILVWFCLFQFWWKEVIADENDISAAQFKMKKIVQKTFISRAREQVTIKSINEEISSKFKEDEFSELEE
ncbi:hypothetical protein [Spiroplasma endosymbiont of Othius punctulatus]|uniref:hypothetical protein n=1 Tax=Spiroplasma endosymbiont of Othius punctulatus TaxID=3066289 RepID=UPI0030D29568